MAEKIKGLDELNKKLEALKGIKTAESLLAGSLTLQRFAQINSPVDTGANRNSAQSAVVSDHAELSFNMEYSYYLENHSEYVQKAIDEHSDDVVKAVKDRLKDDLGGAI